MGMQNWLHWSAWFVKYLIFFLITISLMTFFFCIKVSIVYFLIFSSYVVAIEDKLSSGLIS